MEKKRVTIKDVANLAGVSIGVVSFVINNTQGQTIPEATRERVLDAIKELGYTPNAAARGMRTRKSKIIGLVCFWDTTEHIFVELLEGAYKVAEKNGYNIIICSLNSNQNEFSYIDLFKRQQLDGILFVSPYEQKNSFSEEEHIRRIKENNIPAVIIHGSTNDSLMNYVNVDYYSTTYMAVEYLISLGHRSIGYILPGAKEEKYKANQRMEGFKDALDKSDILMNKELVFELGEVDRIVNSIKEGELTAVVAYKSDYAHRFLEEMMDRGIRIPEDISIIAANTSPFVTYLHPPLTTIHIPFKQIGEEAVDILMNKFKNKICADKIMPTNNLCIRKSCRSI